MINIKNIISNFSKLVIIFFIFLPDFALSYNKESSKTILVTSSTGELGSAIVTKLANKGYNLILTGRNDSKLSTIQESLIGKVKVDIIKFDYNDINQMRLIASKIKDESIDGIVIIPPRPYFNTEEIPEQQEWRANFESVFIGPLEFIRLTASKIKTPGSIVIISGETSKYYIPSYPNTNVLRLMWSGEVKNLCHQYSDKSIRANIVSPGTILTEHHIKKIDDRSKAANKSFDEQLTFETKNLPSKQYGAPGDVANTIEFLLDDNSKHINCENIVINGGANNGY